MDIKRQGMLVSLIGPAGSGKTSLIKMLLAEKHRGHRELSISFTTRKARPGEVNGKDYHFVAEEEFKYKITQQKFFEWEEIHGNFYGTLKETVDSSLKSGTDLLFDIDIRGALNIKKNYPANSINIFILPPSYKVMIERLVSRGTSEEEIKKRSETAKKEYELFLGNLEQIDFTIVNDDLETSFKNLAMILDSESRRSLRCDRDQLNKICRITKL